jgi:hypothetical protein
MSSIEPRNALTKNAYRGINIVFFWVAERTRLRGYFDEIAREPMPQRWVDLIHFLNERDRQKREEKDRGRSVTDDR